MSGKGKRRLIDVASDSVQRKVERHRSSFTCSECSLPIPPNLVLVDSLRKTSCVSCAISVTCPPCGRRVFACPCCTTTSGQISKLVHTHFATQCCPKVTNEQQTPRCQYCDDDISKLSTRDVYEHLSRHFRAQSKRPFKKQYEDKNPTLASSSTESNVKRPPTPYFIDFGEDGGSDFFTENEAHSIVNTARAPPVALISPIDVVERAFRRETAGPSFFPRADTSVALVQSFQCPKQEWNFANLSGTQVRDLAIIQQMRESGRLQAADRCILEPTDPPRIQLLEAPSRDLDVAQVFENETRMHFILNDYLLNNREFTYLYFLLLGIF